MSNLIVNVALDRLYIHDAERGKNGYYPSSNKICRGNQWSDVMVVRSSNIDRQWKCSLVWIVGGSLARC